MIQHSIVKTYFHPDGSHRLEIIRRDDGFYGFIEYRNVTETIFSEERSFWTPAYPSPDPICDSPETAECEAFGRIEWLKR